MDGTEQDHTATDPPREAIAPHAKAVWVTPRLMPADVAGETESGAIAAATEMSSANRKGGS